MSSSTVIKIAGDQGTLMINGLFLWAEDMSYRIWPSSEIFMKYSLAEHILKAWARIGWLVLIFLYVVDHLCHVAWIISSYFWSVVHTSNSKPTWTRAGIGSAAWRHYSVCRVLHTKLQLEQDLNNYFKVPKVTFFFFFFSDSACSPSVIVLRPKALHNPLPSYYLCHWTVAFLSRTQAISWRRILQDA